MSGSDVEAVVVFEEDGPLGSVDGGSEALGLDHEVSSSSRVLLGTTTEWGEWFGYDCGGFVFGPVLLLFLL